MAVRFSSTGLVRDDTSPPPRLASAVDMVLRGVGQVMFQNSSYAGLLFLIGIFVESPPAALAAAIGAAASTAAAAALGLDRAQVHSGLFGFNGALVAIALLTFLRPGALTWGCMVFAAAGSTIVQAALMRLLGPWKIPVLTAPFVCTTLAVLLAAARFGSEQITPALPTPELPQAAEGVTSAAMLVQGLFSGVAQVFFQGNAVSGVVMAAGLLIASRTACAAALAGSLTGLLVGWVMGATEAALRSGVHGFNGALVAIALAGVFIAVDAFSLAYALLATIAATLLYAALSAAFEPLGLPALTLPFVLASWCFLLASPHLPKLRAAAAE